MEKKFYIKIHRSYRSVVAICDHDILGKKFEEGKRQLDVRENFYKGEEFSFENAIKLLKMQRQEDSTFNIAGNNAVKIALDAGIIDEGNVGEVNGIKFALVLL